MNKHLLLLLLTCVSLSAFANDGITTPTDTIPDSLLNGAAIPILTLSETEIEEEEGLENISGLLSASNDVFTRAAAFNFGAARFKIRGYQNNSSQIFLNGSNMNDLETGATYWSMWGGLNDVMRNRNISIGLAPVEYGFGGLNGATNIDITASAQRKQKRISYASSNRSYFNRIMAVYTPELKNDFYLTISGSRRWAKEGYVEGTFYDAWSYFLGVEKKFNGGEHSLALNFLGAPNRRGRNSAITNEMSSITGTNYYNPNWGYQNGKKRNARVNDGHQPIAILQHKWEINGKSKLNTSMSYQFGRNGSSRLNWANAADPRPEYYRNMPSFIATNSSELAEKVRYGMEINPDLMQVDWHGMYNVNYSAEPTTIQDVDGIAGNTVTGRMAHYMLQETRYDRQRFNFNMNFNTELADNIILNSGVFVSRQNTHNHMRVKDLLGADFHYDIDRFAERDFPGEDLLLQSDLNNPHRVVEKGGIFGYSYDSNLRDFGGWAQAQINLDQVDLFVAVNADLMTFWRTGNFRNGRFPDNSYGDSKKENFLQYGAKLGATYKLDGRNYLFVNGARMERAPSYREAYISPRTRHDAVEGLTTEKINTVEGGYYLKAPYYKARITGYYTQFQDGLEVLNFYNDLENAFGAFTTNGVDRQHFGVELAAEAQIVTGLSAQAAIALGQYTYTNRPEGYFILDNTLEAVELGKVYQKNFYVPNTPQRAYSAGLRYNSPKFWFANLTLNMFEKIYLDFDPLARTIAGAANAYAPGSDEWRESLKQKELDRQFTLDFFGGKSWMMQRNGKRSFIYLTVGVSNILNNKNFQTGGYEQLRVGQVDFETDRFYYAFGMNYFAQIAYKF